MGFKIDKANISLEIAKNIATECYIVEELSYMQKKLSVTPKILRMYNSDENNFVIPYYTALKHGFKNENFDWYCIQPLKIDLESKNLIHEIDEESEVVKRWKESMEITKLLCTETGLKYRGIKEYSTVHRGCCCGHDDCEPSGCPSDGCMCGRWWGNV